MSQLERYDIKEEIGRGAMGVVHLAHDTQIDRDVALKEMSVPAGVSAERQQEMLERFEREAKAAGRIEHPNIVRVYDAFSEGDRHFIVMEYLKGRTLAEMVEAGPLSPDAALGVVGQILEALSAAQEKGIVHRDLKPDNVFILDDGLVKVADFGVARVEESPGLTRAGQVLGTLGYMSPEQVRGEAVDGRSDLFAVGVMLYEMLVGQNPFAADQPTTAMYRIAYEEPPDVALFVTELPQHIAPIVKKATAKDPNLRYQGAAEMLADITGGVKPDVTDIEAAAAARTSAAAAEPSAGAPKKSLLAKVSRKTLVAAAFGLIVVTGVAAAGYAYHVDQLSKDAERAAAIRQEGSMMVARVAELKGYRVELERAVAALEKKAESHEATAKEWDAEWQRRQDTYETRYYEVDAHNAREYAMRESSRVEYWDYWYWEWVTEYTYTPRLLDYPSPPEPPVKLSVDLGAEQDRLRELDQRIDDFRSAIASETAGARFFPVVYQRMVEATDVLLVAVADSRAVASDLVVVDANKGQLINESKIRLIDLEVITSPFEQVDLEVALYTGNYGVSLDELLSQETTAAAQGDAGDESDVGDEGDTGQ